MKVNRLDHINIRTTNLRESIEFYGTLLGLPVMPPPTKDDLSSGAYFCDAQGVAIIHLIATDTTANSVDPVRGAAQWGMIDHFALRTNDSPAEFKARLEEEDVAYSAFDVDFLDAHLVFVQDPNGIMVEVGFPLKQQ